MSDPDKAILYYQRSLSIKNEIGSKFDLEILLVNLSLRYNQKKNFAEAEKYVHQALVSCQMECDPYITMQAEFCLGVIRLDQKREAIDHFKAALTQLGAIKTEVSVIQVVAWVLFFNGGTQTFSL